MQACDRCHARKIRCDRRAPRCTVCERANAECFHTDRARDRKVPRAYVQSLEDKIRKLEGHQEHVQRDEFASEASTSLTPHLTGRNSSQPQLQLTVDTPQHQHPHLEHTGTAPERVRETVLTSPSARQGHSIASSTLAAATPLRTYLGSSTNVDFVKVVASNFQGSLAFQEPAELPPSPEPPTVVDDAALPPRQVAEELINAYFAHWHITFPLLHRAEVRKVVGQIYSNPSFYKQEPFHAYSFDMILAMGSVNRNRHEWSASHETHFARAMTKFDKVLRLSDIMPLQALLLCCHYGVFSTLRDTSTDTWHLLGLAARFSTELGLHRRHGYKYDASSTGLFPKAEVHALEMARRCFWCLYNLDRVVSQTLGRPVAVRDDEIDTFMPSRFDDDCADSEHWYQQDSGQWTCPFIEIIGLRGKSGRIHQSLHMNLSLRNLPFDQKTRLRDDLFDELTAWRNHLSSLNFAFWNNSNNSASPFLTRAWYEVIYYNAAITLYRPSPLFPFDGSSDPAKDVLIMKKLWTFSKSSINKYSELLKQRRLNYSWITLYAVFMAGLSYVYSISRLSKRAFRLNDVVPLIEVINDTRLCSNILVAICERWNDARRSCSIFDQLSMAAIQELISVTAQLQSVESGDSTRVVSQQGVDHLQQAYTVAPATSAPYMTTSMTSFDRQSRPDVLGYTGTAQFDEQQPQALDFEVYFQELHGSLSQAGSFPSNEVLLGFDQEWFGDQLAPQK